MSVTLHTSHGDIKIEVFCESVPKTAEAPELPCPLRIRLLRRVAVPPPHPQVHPADGRAGAPGARQPQGRAVHLGRGVRGRDPAVAAARAARHGEHGEQGARHQRVAVLRDARQGPAPGWPEYRLWEGHWRRGHGDAGPARGRGGGPQGEAAC
ncbi:Cyclophilin-like protein [Metarhizium guizhouense ARSEF 977]|uniref:Cyclophilin-like protein n=1 Tax=Metarhizium guizhouense (strain ARSEF 977) TaxID=1276136 RepID=A0A0B4H986_METGA|nr:Cyclophilin-like protein [Metarhizium guizhouense ARSEF 977]